MTGRLIEEAPPMPTGSVPEDIKAQYEYLQRLIQQINFILTQIYRA